MHPKRKKHSKSHDAIYRDVRQAYLGASGHVPRVGDEEKHGDVGGDEMMGMRMDGKLGGKESILKKSVADPRMVMSEKRELLLYYILEKFYTIDEAHKTKLYAFLLKLMESEAIDFDPFVQHGRHTSFRTLLDEVLHDVHEKNADIPLLHGIHSSDYNANMVSRATTDFEEICFLGKGGFGQVLKVRNRLDGVEYALKKVRFRDLPNSMKNFEKVLREVKALAQFDHENVLRYYNAWIEVEHAGEFTKQIMENAGEFTRKRGQSPIISPLSPEHPSRKLKLSVELSEMDLRQRTPTTEEASDWSSNTGEEVESSEEEAEESESSEEEEGDEEESHEVELLEGSESSTHSDLHGVNTILYGNSSDSSSLRTSSSSLRSSVSSSLRNSRDRIRKSIGSSQNSSLGSRSSSNDLRSSSSNLRSSNSTLRSSRSMSSGNLRTSGGKPEVRTPTLSPKGPGARRNLEAIFGKASLSDERVAANGIAPRALSRSGKWTSRELRASSKDVTGTRDGSEDEYEDEEDGDEEEEGEEEEDEVFSGDWGATSATKSLSQEATRLGQSQAVVPFVGSKPPPPPKNRYILYIQMQLCESRTLKNFLERPDRRVNLADNMKIFAQIVSGLRHIHSRGLMHRDLKPENIFFTSNGTVKIGDFGLSKRFSEISSVEEDLFDSNDIGDSHTSGIGTRTYASPEQIWGSSYTMKSDIYSLGIILFELFYIFGTYAERAKMLLELRNGIIPLDLTTKYPEVAKFVLWLMHEDPNKRPSTDDILESSYMTQTTYSKVILKQQEEIARLQEKIRQLESQISETTT